MSGSEMHKNSDGTRTQTHLTNFTGSQPNLKSKDCEENIVESSDEEGVAEASPSNVMDSGDEGDMGI